MIDPSTIQVDIEAERRWLTTYKADNGFSWAQVASRIGVPQGTISQFGPGTYRGNNEAVARDVMRHRQTVEAQAEMIAELPQIPGYQKTTSGQQMRRLLSWAHRGRMVVIACGPGVGKTTECAHYAQSASNVWMATMSQSTAGLNPMQMELLAAMGERDAIGTPQKLTRRICDKVANANGLIIVDEGQALTEKAFEELRSIHDRTGVGLAIVGNESALMRLEGGTRKAAYAQLYSRVSMRMIRPTSLADDALVLAAAWGVTDPRELDFLAKVAGKPGGLRSLTMVMELATMLAFGETRDLTHLQDAWAQLSTRPVAA